MPSPCRCPRRFYRLEISLLALRAEARFRQAGVAYDPEGEDAVSPRATVLFVAALPARARSWPVMARRHCPQGMRVGSIRLARLAETLPAIDWPQTVGRLERQHPPWILRGQSADLIQLPKLIFGECDFDRGEIVLKLVEAFRAN